MTELHNLIDGVAVPLTDAEIAEFNTREEAAERRRANAEIDAQIAALEAMQTPRLIREAVMGLDCTVNKPGSCIHGLTPAAALAALDAQIAALRAQISSDVYYQGPRA